MGKFQQEVVEGRREQVFYGNKCKRLDRRNNYKLLGERSQTRFLLQLRYNHPDAQRDYVALKRTAYTQHPADIQAYNNYKNEWIKRIAGVGTGTAGEWIACRKEVIR